MVVMMKMHTGIMTHVQKDCKSTFMNLAVNKFYSLTYTFAGWEFNYCLEPSTSQLTDFQKEEKVNQNENANVEEEEENDNEEKMKKKKEKKKMEEEEEGNEIE